MNEPWDLALRPLRRATQPRWRALWQQQLERLYASPRLYRWALSNPLTRWLIRRRTQRLFDLMAGFVHSQVLLACVRLNLFRLLFQAPADLSTIAQQVAMPAPSLERLLLAAVSLELLERRSQGRFGLGPLGVPLATHTGLPQMVEHNHLLYEDLRDPLGFLGNSWQGNMALYWPYAHDPLAAEQQGQTAFRRYSELMAGSQGFVVQELLASYPFDKHRCVLDVGAGRGGLIRALAQHAPQLSFQLFDLPPVLELAREALQGQGLDDKLQYHPGSFLDDPLPRGADLITLVRVVHDHPDEVVQQLLRKAHDSLPPGGVLLLAEPMASPANGPPAAADAYFHFYLLAMGAGRLRTPQELRRLMLDAGFCRVERLANAMPIHAQLLAAHKSRCLPL